MTDEQFAQDAASGQEEARQRIVDAAMNPPGSKPYKHAIWYLTDQIGMTEEEALKAIAAYKMDRDEAKAAPKPKAKPKDLKKPAKAAEAPPKKKKKTLKDWLTSRYEEPEFGAETRKRLDGINSAITDDFSRMGIKQGGGMSYTPPLPAPPEDIFSGANSPFADPQYRAR
jgi:hypothetical protein